MKAAALRGALSDRARAGRVHVVDGFAVDGAPSTSTAVSTLATISPRKHVLVVLERGDELTWKSLRSAEQVHLLLADQLNTYDVMVSDGVVFPRGALVAFLARPTGRAAKAVATSSEASALEAEETK